jgi:hypothetical protein
VFAHSMPISQDAEPALARGKENCDVVGLPG